MPLPGLLYPGAPLDDVDLLERLSPEYAQLLAQRNGFVALGGALHVRGACRAPAWHSLRTALEGPAALHRLFDPLEPSDVPFGQTLLGEQLLLRGDRLWRFMPTAGPPVPMELGVAEFLTEVRADPTTLLPLDPLTEFQAAGGRLTAGELLAPADPGWRAVPAAVRLLQLAGRTAV